MSQLIVNMCVHALGKTITNDLLRFKMCVAIFRCYYFIWFPFLPKLIETYQQTLFNNEKLGLSLL